MNHETHQPPKPSLPEWRIERGVWKPQAQQAETDRSFLGVFVGMLVGVLCIGAAVAMFCFGMPWAALGTCCYGLLIVWMSWRLGCRLEARMRRNEAREELLNDGGDR